MNETSQPLLAAEKVTAEHIAFMVRYTSGVICLPMTGERLDELGLPLMPVVVPIA